MNRMKDYKQSHVEERIARQYEEVVYRVGSYDDMLWRWEQDILAREIVKLKKVSPRVSFLDFATGTGRILSFLEDTVTEATGVDNAEAMLRHARLRVRNAELILADLTQEDALAGRSFDIITAFRFFLNAQTDLRDTAFRVLAPKLRGADACFIFNIHGNLWSHRLFSKWWYMLRGRQLNTMTIWQAKRLVRAHGLEVARWYGFGVQPKFLYRLFGPKFMYAVDLMLSKIPGMKYVSYDLIFVCRKKNKNP